jgi:ABC-type dipeptide/oligopeptide/nickel transport system permease subunit
VAGFCRGWVDRAVVLLSDAMLAFPALVLMLAMAAVLGPSLFTITIALSVVWIPTFIRITRANTLPVAGREYVTAARSIGTPSWKIMTFDVLPNACYPVLTYTAVVVAMAIVAEGSLSFLGLGVPPPTPTWGAMIAGGVQALSKSPHIVIMPSVVMVLTIVSLNRLGEGVRRTSAARETQI